MGHSDKEKNSDKEHNISRRRFLKFGLAGAGAAAAVAGGVTVIKRMEGIPQKEFPVFLELISALAKKNNIKIIAIEPQAMIDNPDLFYMEFPVLIDALCGYHDLGRFINNLEDAKIFMKIKDIKIANDDIIPKQHNVFLNISTFCLKEVEDENVSN